MDRKEILQEIFDKSKEFDDCLEHLQQALWTKGLAFDNQMTIDTVGEENGEFFKALEASRSRLAMLGDSYKELLINKPVTRCPFTGNVVEMSVDMDGIDGLWWNSDNPIRLDISAPKTFFAYDGAMKLNQSLEKTPFTVAPGPDSPFVLPRLLSFDQVKAVISQIQVGEHIGYLMTYFCDPFLVYEPRINDWGTNRYWESNPLPGDFSTPGKWIPLDPLKSEMDFDLTHWMQKGKLMWIKPGDTSLRVRSSINSCPFLQLEGKRELQVIKQGELSYNKGFDYVYRTEEEFEALFSKEELNRINEEIERGDE